MSTLYCTFVDDLVTLIFFIMAKGNLFQGMARGKVGDVVFYRMNGWQMARVRNRKPNNPRTNEQLYQRAVIATTMKAYSIGKEIFDHAFQGEKIGEGNMRKFNMVNSRILRSQLINDINGNTPLNDQLGRFCAPKSITPTACIGLQVSEGTLTQTLFKAIESNGTYKFQIGFTTEHTMGTWFKVLNIAPNDIFTFVFFVTDPAVKVYNNEWTTNPLASQYKTSFEWIRFKIKEGIEEKNPHQTPFSDLFEIEKSSDNIKFDSTQVAKVNQEMNFSFTTENAIGSMACIRSRDDMDIRSTEYTIPFGSKDYGIASAYVLDVWKNMVEKVGQSELILEGGDGEGNNTGQGPSYQPMADGTPIDETPVAPVPVATVSKKK